MEKPISFVSILSVGALVLITMLGFAGCTISTPEREYVIIPGIDLGGNTPGVSPPADSSRRKAGDASTAAPVAGNAPPRSALGTLLAAMSPKKPITLEILNNLKTEHFSFTNGEYSDEDPSTPAIRISAGISNKVLGDLNGDGVTDAAVTIWYNTGGSGIFDEICAVVATPESPLVTESIQLGDRIGIRSMRIERGIIILDLMTHGPRDPSSNPTVRAICKFKLAGNRLVNLTPKVLANEGVMDMWK